VGRDIISVIRQAYNCIGLVGFLVLVFLYFFFTFFFSCHVRKNRQRFSAR